MTLCIHTEHVATFSNANDAMQYISFLPASLVLARGLAKAGDRPRNKPA